MRYFYLLFSLPFAVFGQLTVDLDTALSMAYEKNKQLLVLQEMLEEAKAGKTITMSAWLPHLQGVSQGYYNGDYQKLWKSNNAFLTNLSLTQNLFEMTAYYDVKISDLNIKKVQFLYDSLKNEITYDVKRQYFQVILDLEKVATQQENVQLLTQLLKRMKDRLKIGEAIALNVNQSQVALVSQKTKYYQALKQLRDDLNELAYFLGYNPEEITIETKEKRFDLDQYAFLSNLYKKAKLEPDYTKLFSQQEILAFEKTISTNNPLLKTQAMALKMMNENVKKSFGEYYPKLQFVANYGGAPNPFFFYPSSSISNQDFQYGVGLELRWNLFDGFKREGTIKKTRHQKMASFHELEDLTQKVALEFSESVTSLETAIAQVVSSEENVQLAELTLEQAFDQLEIGYYTIYDYQIAVDQLVQVKNMLSDAKYEFFKAFFELEKVLGKPVDKE
jgi:outer membrane protein TolC